MKKILSSALLVLASSLLLASCGGGTDDGISSSTPVEETSATAPVEETSSSVSESKANTHTVSWNKDDAKYTLVPGEGLDASAVEHGTAFTFTLEFETAYSQKKALSVKADGTELVPVEGVYSVLVEADVSILISLEVNAYTVTFANYDGTILQESAVNHGVAPEFKGQLPARFGFSFEGWDHPIVPAVADATYTATYRLDIDGTLAQIPAHLALGDEVAIIADGVTSCGVYPIDSDTPLPVSDGTVLLSEPGVYFYKIVDFEGNTHSASFSVQDWGGVAKNVYDYADDTQRGFNLHNEGSTWLREFEGEYGVRKANGTPDRLRFDIGTERVEWDYVVLRAYFADPTAKSVNLTSFWATAQTDIPTNSWQNVYVPRSAIQYGGSWAYKGGFGTNEAGLTDDAVFYDDCYGTIGYDNQQMFYMDILNGTSDTICYLSSISLGQDNRDPGVIYDYAYPAQRTFNFHNGGTTWLESFEGEYGVRKANSSPALLRFDIGDKAQAWDSVVLRAYFADPNDLKIRVCSFWTTAQADIPTNQWVDVTIPKSAVRDANSWAYRGGFGTNTEGLTDDAVFESDVFGTIGYTNQQMFYMDILDGSSSTVCYLSSIKIVVNE